MDMVFAVQGCTKRGFNRSVEMRGRPRISGRLIIGSYQTLSHAAVKCIQTSIPPTSQPPNKHMPVDPLGMNLTANASVIYRRPPDRLRIDLDMRPLLPVRLRPPCPQPILDATTI